MIGHDVEISVLAVSGDKVRLGISAPRSIPVFRREIYVEIHGEPGEVGAENGTAQGSGSQGKSSGPPEGASPPSGQAADRSETTAAD